jgi:hypothetical protein
MSENNIFIHQPDFLPWIGFFQKLKKSNIFVVLDDVQFIKRGWINRDKFIINGEPRWLTIPVKTKGNYCEIIKNIQIDYGTDWTRKFSKTLKHSYQNSPYFDKHFYNIIEIFYEKKKYLIDLNLKLLEYVIKYFNFKCKIIFSSSLDINLKKSERILEILKRLNADNYITGMGSVNYLDIEIFKKNEIKIVFCDYEFKKYPQNSKIFQEKLSILDYLFNTKEEI